MSDPAHTTPEHEGEHEHEAEADVEADLDLDLEFELTYPNALDGETLASAAAFHNASLPPPPPNGGGGERLSPKQWENRCRPEDLGSWTDWVLVQAIGKQGHGEVLGQCVVVKWEVEVEAEVEGRGKVLFVVELLVRDGVGVRGESGRGWGKDCGKELLRRVKGERMVMRDVGFVGMMKGDEGVVREVLSGRGEDSELGGDVLRGVLRKGPLRWLGEEEEGQVVVCKV